jgi:hypothetical protein
MSASRVGFEIARFLDDRNGLGPIRRGQRPYEAEAGEDKNKNDC